MRPNRFSSLLVTLIFAMSGTVAVAASEGTVKGRVSDSLGAAIKGARLLFHLDTSGRTDGVQAIDSWRETDRMGSFDVQLEPGVYDVCVMAMAFTPSCRKILVSKNGTVQHAVRLNVDPLVSKHLGDTF